jgi:replication factor C subunit 2/4
VSIDLRNALNALQGAAALDGKIDENTVYKIVDQPHPIKINQILQCCVRRDLPSALAILTQVIETGYAPSDIAQTLFRVCKYAQVIDDKLKVHFVGHIRETVGRILEGLSTPLQLSGLLARLCLIDPNKEDVLL